MANELATAFVRIRPQTSGFKSELSGQVGGATRGLAGEIAKTATLLIGGAGIATGIASILKIGVAYRDSLNTFQAVTEATKSQMLQVSIVAKQLGNDITIPGANASDAANAMTELARAGLSVTDSMNAAKGSLQLAAAGETNAKEAAQAMAGALNTFALAGTDAVRIADLIASTANNSAASLTDVEYGLSSVGSAAHAAGFNINETTTALGELSNAGLSGERAGTTLRSLLISLEKPSKKAQAALDSMGVSIYDQRGKMKPLVEIIGEFQTATQHMTAEQRNANFAQIAGTYGLTALNVLVGKGTKSYLDMERANLKQGAASDLAKAKMTGLGGSVRGLSNTLETAAISVYQRFSPGLERGVLSVNKFVSSVTSSKGFGADLQAASNLAVGAVESLVTVFKDGVTVLQALSPEISAVVGVLQGLGAGPILVAVGVFKAINLASAAWTATQARLNALVAAANAPTAAAAAETARLAVAEQAAAAAAAEMATAQTAATASSARLGAASATSSLTSLGGGLRTATTAASELAPAVAGVEGAALAAAPEVGLLGAATAAIAPIAIVAGVAALAAGIFYLSTQASQAERAAKATSEAVGRLASTTAAYKQAVQSGLTAAQTTSDLKLQREQAVLGIQQAEQRLAVDRKSHSSNLTLAQDAINVRIANEGWRSANAAVLGSQNNQTAATKKQIDVSKQHRQALGQLITALNDGSNAASKQTKTVVAGRVPITQSFIDQAQKVAAVSKAYGDLAKRTADSQPLLSKSAGFVKAFTDATGKVPSRTEVTFILNHTKADTDFGDVLKKLTAFERRKNEARLGLDANPFNDVIQRVAASAPGYGSNIGVGLATGVTTGLSSVDIGAVFAGQISAAVAKAKKAAGVKSPSSVTRDQLGRPLMQGISLGLTIETPKAVATAESAALKVTNAFVGSLAGFKEKASKALDFKSVFTQNIRDAILSARSNLGSLGSTLSQSLGTYLDAQNNQALALLKNNATTGDPAIKAIQDRITKRAHDASVKGAADAVTAAQNEVARLTAQGGPDSFDVTAADDAVAAAQQSLQTLQQTNADQKQSLTDALIKAQQDLATAVNGTPSTDKSTAGSFIPGTPLQPGKPVGSPFSKGTLIAGTYHPATPDQGTPGTTSTSGGTDPLDPLGQRAAQRAVRDAQRAVDLFDADYQRSLNAGTKAVHDAQVARGKLDTDYTDQVKQAQESLTTALNAQLDIQDTDLANHLQTQLDDASLKQQQETDNAKLQLDQQINDLTNALALKQITLSQFQSAVLADVNAYAPGWKEAGGALGSSFVDGIQETIASLLAQANLLATGPAATAPGGSTNPHDVVDPTAVQRADAATLRKAVLDARDTIKGDIATIAKDSADAVKKTSEGGVKITASEQAGINRDKAQGNKDYQDLIVAMRALAANAGWKEGMQIGSLTIANDPEQVVSAFLRNLAASQNK